MMIAGAFLASIELRLAVSGPVDGSNYPAIKA